MSFLSVLMMIILRMPAGKHLLRCHCNRKVLRNKQLKDENQSHLTERTPRLQSWRWRTSGSARHSWWGTCPSETPISLHSPTMKRAATYETKQKHVKHREMSWWRRRRVSPPSAQSKWRECCSLWMGRSPEGRGQPFQVMCMYLAHLLLYLEHVREEFI